MKKFFLIASFSLGALILSGCVTHVHHRDREVVRSNNDAVRTVYDNGDVRYMPSPVNEVITVTPGPSYSWVPGHWYWVDTRWVWQNGHWYNGAYRPMPALIVERMTIAPGPGHYWVPGHWNWHRNDWRWNHGHWRR